MVQVDHESSTLGSMWQSMTAREPFGVAAILQPLQSSTGHCPPRSNEMLPWNASSSRLPALETAPATSGTGPKFNGGWGLGVAERSVEPNMALQQLAWKAASICGCPHRADGRRPTDDYEFIIEGQGHSAVEQIDPLFYDWLDCLIMMGP